MTKQDPMTDSLSLSNDPRLCCRAHPHEKQSLYCQLREVSAWLRLQSTVEKTLSAESILSHAEKLDTITLELLALQEVNEEPVAPDFYTACEWHSCGEGGSWIAIPRYSSETEHGVKHLLLEAARKEGYKGTLAGRLFELGWEIRPAYLRPSLPKGI